MTTSEQPSPGRTMLMAGAVLAAVAGAVDVLAFTQLGQAFASVITGNVVVAAASAAGGDVSTFISPTVAIGAYGAGVALGAIGLDQAAPTSSRAPILASVRFTGELVALIVLAVVWFGADGKPAGAAQYAALVAAAVAMGLQSTAFRLMRLPGVTTTYFTGTLTNLLVSFVGAGRVNTPAAIALLALFVGAAATGVLISQATRWAPLLAIVLLSAVLVHSVRRRHAPVGH